jgi:putative FmdB family regulatory protein
MPLYEYQCSQCGERFEVMQKFADEPLATHSSCGGPVERLLSAPALQFKGSGWYVTDYAKSGGGGNGKSESKGESKPEAKSEAKSESKPAASTSDSK